MFRIRGGPLGQRLRRGWRYWPPGHDLWRREVGRRGCGWRSCWAGEAEELAYTARRHPHGRMDEAREHLGFGKGLPWPQESQILFAWRSCASGCMAPRLSSPWTLCGQKGPRWDDERSIGLMVRLHGIESAPWPGSQPMWRYLHSHSARPTRLERPLVPAHDQQTINVTSCTIHSLGS